MNQLRAVIIDDETAAVYNLAGMLEEHTQNVKVLAGTTQVDEGVGLINNHRPDIVFLDINMPGTDGFTMLQQIDHKDFKLVFTTAYAQYAIQAIRHGADDYLLKPVNAEELKNCISHISPKEQSYGTAYGKKFPAVIELSVKDGIIFIRVADIIRLEASGSYTVFILDNNTRHVVSKSLKEYEVRLDPSVFYRCHHSHIINLKKVVKFVSNDGYYAQMSDGSRAEISRKNKEAFLENLKHISF